MSKPNIFFPVQIDTTTSSKLEIDLDEDVYHATELFTDELRLTIREGDKPMGSVFLTMDQAKELQKLLNDIL